MMLINRKSQKRQICELLERMISNGSWKLGERLPAISELALRFGTSPRTVHLALRDLAVRGYVELRHGSGTFIRSNHRPLTMGETIVVCMETRAHLFGELAAALVNALNGRHMVPLVVDTMGAEGSELLGRIAHTDAACFMVHSSSEELLDLPLLRHKPVISFVHRLSAAGRENFFQVLANYDYGGRLVAKHLWERGFRRVLVLGTGTMPYWLSQAPEISPTPATSFVAEWSAAGGQWDHLESVENPSASSGYSLDSARLLDFFADTSLPCAVFGVRDVEAWEAQRIIREQQPELLSKIEIVGYYDTPWSRAGGPPFSSVNVNMEEMAGAAMNMLDKILSGERPNPEIVLVRPNLVLRR